MKSLVNNPVVLAAVLIACVLVLMTSGCSTVAGFGKDLTSTAEWTKDKMFTSKDSTKDSNQKQ